MNLTKMSWRELTLSFRLDIWNLTRMDFFCFFDVGPLTSVSLSFTRHLHFYLRLVSVGLEKDFAKAAAHTWLFGGRRDKAIL